VNFTAGAPGTNSVCVNGTGITLAPSTTGFDVSSDNVVFDGAFGSSSPSGSASPSGSVASQSGSSTAAPSASATAKSGAGRIQVGIASFIGIGCVALALW